MKTIHLIPRKNSEDVKYHRGMNLKMIPELHAIKRTKHYIFLYSPLKSRIHVLSAGEFKKMKKGELSEEEMRKFFEDGILIPADEDPYPPKIDINSVTLKIFFTNRCNLNCIYCYRKDTRSWIDNSFEGIKNFMNFVRNRWGKDAFRAISYYSSGEPTMAFQLMRRTHEYFKKMSGNEYSASLVSNGTFSKEVADWVMENDIIIQISCDGPPHIQDAQRPFANGKGSSFLVERNLKYFIRKGYKKMGTNSVITKHTLKHMEEIFNYFFRMGVPKIGFGYAYSVWHNRSLEPDMIEFAKNSLKVFELAEHFNIVPKIPLFRPVPSRRFCAAGTMLTVHEDGKIGTCNRAGHDSKSSRFFVIGDYNKNNVNIDEKKRVSIANRDVEKLDRCKKCAFRWNCRGLCPFDLIDTYGSPEPRGEKCEATKYFLRKLLDYRIERDFRKIKPALELMNGKMYYSMNFHRFELTTVTNEDEVKPNSFIKIDRRMNFNNLLKNILRARDSYGYKTCIFLLSFGIDNTVNRSYGEKIVKLLEKLREEKVFFVVTRPICRKVLGSAYTEITKKFNIPDNWFESVELFTLKGKYALWGDGNKIEIKDEMCREDLYKIIRDGIERPPFFKKCKFCVYLLRGDCPYMI